MLSGEYVTCFIFIDSASFLLWEIETSVCIRTLAFLPLNDANELRVGKEIS